jgi:hypothetical protein
MDEAQSKKQTQTPGRRKKQKSKNPSDLVDEANEKTSLLGISSDILKANNSAVPIKSTNNNNSNNKLAEISNHFALKALSKDGKIGKTSNNKLDDSLRLSYAELSEVLKTYKSNFSTSIDSLNAVYEESYFEEWMGLTK